MPLHDYDISTFQHMIFSWWETNKRDLPWRHTRDPYLIHVSEVMLQQTQVERVKHKYQSFIKEFPTVSSLSYTSTSSVLKHWKGLGYNRRALYLKQAATIVVQQYASIYPETEHDLLSLPGLGTYTTRAILVFAYNHQRAFVDTNIRKIIQFYFFHNTPQKESVIQSTAEQLLPPDKAWEWHQALMDFGSTIPKTSRTKNKSQTTIPFKDTNRFVRGKIMDLARVKNWNHSELLQYCTENYNIPTEKTRHNLLNLKAEGLLSIVKDEITLPA